MRDSEELDAVVALAAELETRTVGKEREEAHRLVVYAAACREDVRAGVEPDSTMWRLFRRK